MPRAAESRFRFSASQGVKLWASWAQAWLQIHGFQQAQAGNLRH